MNVGKWFHSRRGNGVALAVVLLVIIGFSLNPRPESVLGPLSVYDKAEHFAGYFVLAFFTLRVFARRGFLFVVLAIVACAALGGAIEIIQPYVGRHKDILDFSVDLAGSAAGAAVSGLLARRWPVGGR